MLLAKVTHGSVKPKEARRRRRAMSGKRVANGWRRHSPNPAKTITWQNHAIKHYPAPGWIKQETASKVTAREMSLESKE